MRSLSFIHRTLRGAGVFLALAGLALAGCSTLSNPIMPSTLQAPLTVKARALTLSPDAFTAVTLGPARGKFARTKPLVATQTITAAAGGSLALSGAIPSGGTFDYRLSFPAGALSEDTEVAISVPNDNEAVVELLPHGIQFAKPVAFNIRVDVAANPDLNGINQATLDTYWYNNIMEAWQGQSAVVVKDGSVITASVGLGHFSRYALGGDKDKKDDKGKKK